MSRADSACPFVAPTGVSPKLLLRTVPMFPCWGAMGKKAATAATELGPRALGLAADVPPPPERSTLRFDRPWMVVTRKAA
ncbi:hypothetical protein EMIT0P74_240003 [Pseudomonas sp. IT-P74]